MASAVMMARNEVLHYPQESSLQRWNTKILVLLCLVALLLDPLFLYIPVLDNTNTCLWLDLKLEITAIVLRSLTDFIHVTFIAFQFWMHTKATSNGNSGTSIVDKDVSRTARGYLTSRFLIEILSILPLPQVAVLLIVPKMRGSRTLNTLNVMKYVIFIQFVPRFLRMCRIFGMATKISCTLKTTIQIRVVFTIFLYIIAGHYTGAIWYSLSIERQTACWEAACHMQLGCMQSLLYCNGNNRGADSRKFQEFLEKSCAITSGDQDGSAFNFGMYSDIIKSGALESRNYVEKSFYCFWWALQNLSTLGQNLKTSTYIWEILFALSILICGLILFSFVIGILQTTMFSETVRLDGMKMKWEDIEHWMHSHSLPENLRKSIRRHEQHKWERTRGVDVENVLYDLPKYLRMAVKREIYLGHLQRVPILRNLNLELLDELCDCLKPVFYTEKSCIIENGDVFDGMLFIKSGELMAKGSIDGSSGSSTIAYIKGGDYFGEELLSWALLHNSSSSLPKSTTTILAITEVEAFALMADDLKFVALKFELILREQQHICRHYSPFWRAQAAYTIQKAWRRFFKRKLEDSLRQQEDRL